MLKYILLATCVFMSGLTKADTVYELLEVFGGEKQITDLHQPMVEMITNSSPALAPYSDVLLQWTQKYLTWQEMREPMAALYKKHFTEQEMQQMLAFYKTPVGAKTIQLMPQLFSEGGQIGMQLAQKYQPQLQQMLKESGL